MIRCNWCGKLFTEKDIAVVIKDTTLKKGFEYLCGKCPDAR